MIMLPEGSLGYDFANERRNTLEINGNDPLTMREAFRDTFPKFDTTADPLGVFDILNQKSQGACQGHALAGVFSACFFLATGRKPTVVVNGQTVTTGFSRAAGYYLSQRKDGIRGDRGSTLSGGQWVATEHGMCLETDWKYPSYYDPTEPSGLGYPFKLKVTRPMRTVEEVLAWIDSGLPVQIGLPWNNSCNRELVDNWQPLARSGGHSTFFWQRDRSGNIRNINSWGSDWNGDGAHSWTEASIDRALRHKFTVMIGYGPDEMSFPTQEPIS